MEKRELCVRLDIDLVERLEALASDIGKPVEYMLQTAVEKYLRDCDESAD
jgi:predicted DNA-binding protein